VTVSAAVVAGIQPPRTFESPEGRFIGRPSAVFEAAYGSPSAEEAAALTAAVQVLLKAESSQHAPELPWPYRSAWRRAVIDEGIRGTDVS
jgi:hypothetical protein